MMQPVAWYIRRLSLMSPLEAPARTWRAARDVAGRYRRWPTAAGLPLQQFWRGPCDAAYFRDRAAAPLPGAGETPGPDWPEAWRERCVAEADDLLAHRVSIFGHEPLDLGPTLRWNRDYRTGQDVPLAYAPSLDYRDPRVAGDVKWVWELSRHQHLVRLAQAYRLTGDGRYAAEVCGQVASWIEQCPYMHGVHWTCGLESGLRLVSWAWAFEAVRGWPGLVDAFVRRLAASVHQHLEFIEGHYSRHSSAGNHLIGEAAGAYVAASCWPELVHAARWRRRARRILCQEALAQIWPDGVGKEQATGYQFFIFDLLLLAAQAGERQGDAFPPAYGQRLERAAEFLAWISDSRGHTPQVGDEDGGAVLRLAGRDDDRTRSLLNTASIVFGRSDFRSWAGGAIDEKTAWLFGREGRRRYETLDVDTPHTGVPLAACPPVPSEQHTGGQAASGTPSGNNWRGSRTFPDGGWAVLRSGKEARDEAVLLFSAGPLGYPATAAHGHAAALAVTLSVGGEPILIDPGTTTYRAGPWRSYFRATAQHNTLAFPEESQAEEAGPFLWGRRPQTHLAAFDTKDGEASASGRVRWAGGATHERSIHWDAQAGRLEIEDRWRGARPPAIRFCLAPEARVHVTGHTAVITCGQARVELSAPSRRFQIEEVTVAPQYDHAAPSQRLCLTMTEAAGACRTVIQWRSSESTRTVKDSHPAIPESLSVMGVPVLPLDSYEQAVTCVARLVAERGRAYAVAINPEKILRAAHDGELRRILCRADMGICDGIGAALAVRLLYGRRLKRCTGVDLFEALVGAAGARGWRVFLLGASPESNAAAARNLQARHPALQIVGRRDGYFSDDAAVVREVNAARPDLVFVAMGSPRQELWIGRHRAALDAPFCLGVGGTFDVAAGLARRAPRLFRDTGTEFLYRLLANPTWSWRRRVQRGATLVWFAWEVVRARLFGAAAP
jgi:exopolysaccharide biosynthesis WecB/TagA/CpsF family protein